MPILTAVQIIDALARNQPDRLVGSTESDQVEFKLAPYRLAEAWYYNVDRTPDAPLILHPVAVVEVTLEFFRFLYAQIKPRAARGRWRYRILCRRFRSHRVALPADRTDRSRLRIVPPPVASSDEWDQSFDESGTAQRDAFEAVRRFYALFGHGPTAIPLAQDSSISEDELARIR